MSWKLACLVITAAWGFSGCGDFDCCNSCGRTYFIGSTSGTTSVRVSGIDERGNECTLSDVPHSISDGLHTFEIVVVERGDQIGTLHSFTVTVSQQWDGVVASEKCDFAPRMTALDFMASDASVGDHACVVDQVEVEEMCTQEACLST